MSSFSSYGLKICLCIFIFVPPISQGETTKSQVDQNQESAKDVDAVTEATKPYLATKNVDQNESGDTYHIMPITETYYDSNDDNFKEQEILTTDSIAPNLDTKTDRQSRKKKRKSRRRDKLLSRRYITEEMMNTPSKWLHCHDLLSPFVSGMKTQAETKQILIGPNDSRIISFIRLLNVNTTASSQDEIYSILYHISQFNIRLFQWEVPGIELLLSTITRSRVHTWKKIQDGLRALMKKWHMDLDDTSGVLHATKIIRPLCLKVSEYGGSTMASSGVTYSKLTSPTTKCAKKDTDDSNY